MLAKFNKFLAELFKYPEEFIKNNLTNIYTRKSKIDINDTLFYRFRYIFDDKSNTFESITSSINFNKSLNNLKFKCFTRSGIYKKEKYIPSLLYNQMYNKIKEYYNDNFGLNDVIIAIDGVYSNTNLLHNGKIETCMNLGFYDISNGIPIDVHFTGAGKKNNECISLKKYINDNLNYFKGKTIICDRAYYCFSFFNFLVDNNINFIIRLRDNAFDNKINDKSKHFNEYIKIKNNDKIKVITNKFNTSKLVVDDTNSKTKIEKETVVKLLTNLSTLEDDKILELYKNRWNIEEFYKQLKHNFKFQNLIEHKEESYKKNIYSSLIMVLIKQILLKCYEREQNFANKKIVGKKKDKEIKIIKSINENLLINGIKEELLKPIIYKKLNENILKNYLKTYVKIEINEIGRHYERKSKRPFTKWYVKQYHDIYKIRKKCLEEEISYYLKNNENELVNKLKLKRKELNKEYKKLKSEIKENIKISTKDEVKKKT